MAIRFLGEKPTPTRTTETRAVKNWQSFAELFDAPDRSDEEKLAWIRGELEAGYPRFTREDYREALRWLMDYMGRRKSA